ncbi:RNA polymerase Rpb4-domain-containing protein [Podospora didyma]|uniref:DNA-directed RNA polymerase III subunit RPC9 n=1 Tax=Podospora didyma TaxID=330526 RepID=A0AAE0NSY0_9PEZI|nr:RNA polymerase Rpb4-domain-containing protein [Podospora didyma]
MAPCAVRQGSKHLLMDGRLSVQVVKYLQRKPGPLEKQEEKHDYSPSSASQLLERLRGANLGSELAKGELLQILNLRPASNAQLATAVEDLEERFTEDEQQQIVDIIAEVLGRDEPAVYEEDGEDGGEPMESVENGN